MKQNAQAFTLIELLVVLCLCALISSLALVQLSFLDATLVRVELDKLVNACQYMQQLAIATNKEQHLVFDVHKHEYHFHTYHEKLSSRVRFGVLSGVKGSPASPSHTITQAVTFPGQRMSFYPTGVISSGAVYLVDVKKQCLYAMSNAVSHVSYVRMYRYDGTWKLYGDDKKQL